MKHTSSLILLGIAFVLFSAFISVDLEWVQAHALGRPDDATEYWDVVGHRLKITDTLLAIFTLALVLVGLWQGEMLRRTVAATRKSADALPAVERAYIFVRPSFSNPGLALDAEQRSVYRSFTGVFTLINYGRTPAIIQSVHARLAVGDDLPERRPMQEIAKEGQVIDGEGKDWRLPQFHPLTIYLTDAEGLA
jgi:hypothetical protein